MIAPALRPDLAGLAGLSGETLGSYEEDSSRCLEPLSWLYSLFWDSGHLFRAPWRSREEDRNP